MSDDVRAAAERLRRYKSERYTESSAYCTQTSGGPEFNEARFNEDTSTLADAYLAEHPADENDPLTPERLKAFGFTEVENQWGGLALRVNGRTRLGHDSTVPASEQWVAFDGDGGAGIYVPAPETVGGLRRLCAVLGIPLTEGPATADGQPRTGEQP